MESNLNYVGQYTGTFGERFKENIKAASPIYGHLLTTGHTIVIENFSIMEMEEHTPARIIKEYILTRINQPVIN